VSDSRSNDLKHRLPAAPVPAAVAAVAARLRGAGFGAWLVGEALHEHITGRRPRAFELATAAPAARTLDLFPAAVSTQPAHGIVTVPTAAGPVDVAPLRNGPDVEGDLERRPFTVFAIACDPNGTVWVDPHGGRADAAAGRLRCVGLAAERLRDEPLRALQALRLVAEHGYTIDPELEAALAAVGSRIKRLPASRSRPELARLLQGGHVGRGLALLRRSGLEARLVKGVRPDAADLVAALPRNLDLRLAGWLRGTRPGGLLRRQRFGIARSMHVERLLEHHPLDEKVTPNRDRSLLRLLRQLDDADLEALFAMREWELDRRADEPAAGDETTDAEKRLAAVRAGIERVRQNRARTQEREELALDGRTVMQILGCGPGQRVGRALRFLADRAAEQPERNTPEDLRATLLDWSEHNPDRLPGKSRRSSSQ
jgi:tRNA nucleotidyltransferase (CCA-adding enzyme)